MYTTPPPSAGVSRASASSPAGTSSGGRTAAGGAVDCGAVSPTSIVLTAALGSRSTVGNDGRMVAASTFSRSVDPSGCPTLITTTPPGLRCLRTSAKNSLVER